MDAIIITNGTPKEIAALVLAVQERQEENFDALMEKWTADLADLNEKLSSVHIPESS